MAGAMRKADLDRRGAPVGSPGAWYNPCFGGCPAPFLPGVVFRAAALTLLLSAGVHGGALVNMPDQAAAIRSLAGADARMPHWTMTHLAW